MKTIYFLLLFLSLSEHCICQSLKMGTISYSGSNFTNSTFKGGFTLGEVGIKTSSNGNKIIEGFQYIHFLNGYPNCLLVKNTNNEGPGSFRKAIECSAENDEITFSPNMNGSTILLELPPIFIDKNLSILNTNILPVSLSGFSINNIANIYISSNVEFDNVKLGGSNSTFKIELLQGSNVVWH